jgi:hypothetical protein
MNQLLKIEEMKTQIRHLIILIPLLFLGLGAQAHVFLDPAHLYGGDNNNSGADCTVPVRTFAQARIRVKEQMDASPNSKPWIILMGSTITVNDTRNWNGSIEDHDDWVIHIKRIYGSNSGHDYSGIYYTGPIFTVTSAGDLRLSNIVIDGTGYGNGGNPIYKTGGVDALIYLEAGAHLTLNSGAILQNNHRLKAENTPNSTLTTCGGAIEGVMAHVTMNGGRITNCKADKFGGGIYLYSTGATSDATTSSFTMNGGEIDHCEAYAAQCGGGVYITGINKSSGTTGDRLWYAQVNLHKGKIHDNYGSINRVESVWDAGRGAGIHCSRSKVTMDGDEMEIYNNQTYRYGGGIQIAHGSIFDFSKGKIYNNTAYNGTASDYESVNSGGAGIHLAYGLTFDSGADSIPSTLNMTGGEIYGNKALNGYGGGIHTSSVCVLNITGGKIHDNEAMIGGGINLQVMKKLEFAADATVEIYGNKAKNGGGISIDGSPLIVRGGSFHDNVADAGGSDAEYGKGGAFYVHTDNGDCKKVASVKMYGGTICNNSASRDGGGIYIRRPRKDSDPDLTDKKTPVLIQGGLLEGNSAGRRGGGVYAFYGNVTLAGSDIINNTSVEIGGGILIDGNSSLTVGEGDINVKGNTGAGAPHNIYLSSGKVISIASGATFNPRYVGIYTASSNNTIDVFQGTAAQISAIYNGMTSDPVTMNVFDDKQIYSPRIKPSDNKILQFTNTTPWSPLQQTTTTSDLHLVGGVYEISNVKELTAFLWHVNGITTHGAFGSGDAAANGKLTADIDMEGHYWVPISTGYTGTFDGNGYTISHLTMAPTNSSSSRGMFGTNTSGTIKNVILKDCYFASTTATSTNFLGCIVSENELDGKVFNNVADGMLYAQNSYCIMGGIAGRNLGTIHSTFASPSMIGYQMGGLVGHNVTSGTLYNSFANASFDYKGDSKYCGGLVGVNAGTVENCYARLQGTAPASNFGYLIGSNKISTTNGNLNYCYASSSTYTAGEAGNQTGLGTYGATSTPYLYNHRDNQITLASGTSPYVSNVTGADKQMLIALNKWVADPDHGSGNYTYWLRTTTKTINDDLPILRLPATNAVAATNGSANLDYNQVNDLLTAYTAATQAICLYGAEASMDGNASSAASLYIDEEATLKQSGSKGDIIARTSQMLKTYTAERWHHFSSPLQRSGIGFNYGITTEVGFSWDSNPCNVTFSSNDDDALFPSNTPSITDVDLYCFYEPEYHWINFKRNSISHWHMNAHDVKINYRGNGIQPIDSSDPDDPSNGNETYLVPGKGYLVSVDVDQLVQNYGTLNNGNVTLYSVTKSDYNAWAERLGFNLLGNPYQSYLDFEEFKDENGSNLWASNADIYEYTYAVFDPQLNAYRQYKDGSSVFSNAASQYIHPHQGFFIRMTNGTDPANRTTVTYTDDMRVVTLPENVTSPYRGATQPAFPLINLVVRDSEGNGDVAVLELDRANDEGAEKIRLSECKGLLSLGYEGRDYGILFRTEIEDYQPLRFEALEEGTFTLEWTTANGQFSELTLIDNIAGTTTDMLSRDSYSFEGNPDQYASRFKIVIGDYKDIEDHEGDGPSTGSGSFAFMMGDELVVNGEGALFLYDVTGRLLMQTSLHGSQTNIALPEVSAGVYVLHLANDRNGMKTQKIILE